MGPPRTAREGEHDLKSIALSGARWGAIGAFIMAMYAMVAAATYQGTGFFTPTYHIASVVVDPEPMMKSMQHAMRDQIFFFRSGPAMTGMLIHLAVGVAYGVIFALIAHSLRLRALPAVVAGMAYGVIVMLFSAFVGLPLAASIFGGGDPISTMPTMVGWSTFTIEHLMFGGTLGVGHALVHRQEVTGGVVQTA